MPGEQDVTQKTQKQIMVNIHPSVDGYYLPVTALIYAR